MDIVLQRFDNLSQVSHAAKQECAAGKAYNWNRKYLLRNEESGQIAFISLNLMQRFSWALHKLFCRNYFQSIFDAKNVKILSNSDFSTTDNKVDRVNKSTSKAVISPSKSIAHQEKATNASEKSPVTKQTVMQTQDSTKTPSAKLAQQTVTQTPDSTKTTPAKLAQQTVTQSETSTKTPPAKSDIAQPATQTQTSTPTKPSAPHLQKTSSKVTPAIQTASSASQEKHTFAANTVTAVDINGKHLEIYTLAKEVTVTEEFLSKLPAGNHCLMSNPTEAKLKDLFKKNPSIPEDVHVIGFKFAHESVSDQLTSFHPTAKVFPEVFTYNDAGMHLSPQNKARIAKLDNKRTWLSTRVPGTPLQKQTMQVTAAQNSYTFEPYSWTTVQGEHGKVLQIYTDSNELTFPKSFLSKLPSGSYCFMWSNTPRLELDFKPFRKEHVEIPEDVKVISFRWAEDTVTLAPLEKANSSASYKIFKYPFSTNSEGAVHHTTMNQSKEDQLDNPDAWL